jgi:hypothetical protein
MLVNYFGPVTVEGILSFKLVSTLLEMPYIRDLFSTQPIMMTAQSKAWTVFARSNAGIVGSNPTQDVDVCVCVRYIRYVANN